MDMNLRYGIDKSPVKLWLDDLRAAPDGWTWAHSVRQAKEILASCNVAYMSLDHDLGGSCDGGCWDHESDPMRKICSIACDHFCHETGYDFVKWMAEFERWPTHKPLVHSANPVGRANMQATINRYFPG